MPLLKVESSNVTNLGHYCNKLVCKSEKTVATPFGNNTSNTQETYYMFTNNPNTVGFEAELDLSKFDIVNKPFDMPKEDGSVERIQLKYLYPKR